MDSEVKQPVQKEQDIPPAVKDKTPQGNYLLSWIIFEKVPTLLGMAIN